MEQKRVQEDGWKWDSVPAGCGIIAIRRKSDGRSYFLAVSDTRQRVYDHHLMLVAGTHHNPELQAAWTAAPEDFQIIVVESLRCTKLLRAFKQTYIERSAGNCFNRKASIPTCRTRCA